MTRIYGITFPKKKMLDEYLLMLEEAKKRDHRKIGKEMELFMFSERVGKGLPIGSRRARSCAFACRSSCAASSKPYNYQEVITPGIGGKQLYVTSGHYAHYGKDAFQPIHTPEEDEEYMLKPMNCPHHCEIFGAQAARSYKDLPLRIAEFGTVFRYEKSGELHGLTRVRTFTQDDAHIFVRPDQVKAEFENVIDIIRKVFAIFKFEDFEAQISLRDPKDTEKYIGSDEIREESRNAIREACREGSQRPRGDRRGRLLRSEARLHGEGRHRPQVAAGHDPGRLQPAAALPPRIHGRGQLQADAGDDPPRAVRIAGALHRRAHRAHRGPLPLWLTPDQVAILPISEKYNDYAEKLRKYFDRNNVRAYVDDRNEKIGRKIRDNELKRVPYMLVVGEKEAEDGLVSMRKQGGGEQATMTMEEFAQRVNAEVAEQLKVLED